MAAPHDYLPVVAEGRYAKNAGAVYSLKHHLVWCPKYRRPVLDGPVAERLRHEFGHLRSRLPTLWSRSYYAGSVGHVSEATVRRYIEAQKGV